MVRRKLNVTLEFDLDMVEIMDEFAPVLNEVHLEISGPENSKKAADAMHENKDILLPFLIAEFLMKSSTTKSTPAIKAACKMVLKYLGDSTERV